jgi:cyclohexadieny/prephenate dehydrogenase
MFRKICLIGFGLIGSSVARAVKANEAVFKDTIISGYDADEKIRRRAKAIDLVDEIHTSVAQALEGAECAVICVPVGRNRSVMDEIAAFIKGQEQKLLVTDVASVKGKIVEDAKQSFADSPNIRFVPAHPIAGTEYSGPEAGFATLFEERWNILTPYENMRADGDDIAAVKRFWQALGAKVQEMSPDHHDQVLAITSHLPHVIAYTIVGTATQLEDDLKEEVMRYSASGFHDFTRIAASDPIMWRDVMLNNKQALLDLLARFQSDLSEFKTLIEHDRAEELHHFLTQTRDIRLNLAKEYKKTVR